MDVWAFGICLYVYINSRLPLIDGSEEKNLTNYEQVLDKAYIEDEISELYRDKGYSDELIEVEKKMGEAQDKSQEINKTGQE